MSTARNAVTARRKGGNLREAVEIALGRKSFTEGEASSSQTQKWLVPDHSKANRALLGLKKYMPDATVSLSPNDKPAGGYILTISGTFMPNAVASLLTGLGGVMRVDNSSGMDLGVK